MTRITVSKKILTFLLAFSIMFCFVGAFGNVTASAATDRVSLYLLDPYFGADGCTSYYAYIQTKDNASNQAVYVHYQYAPGFEWTDAQATYFTTLPDGSKIWKAAIVGPSIEYAIRYEADGVTYWDNNGGNNYKTQLLGTAPITVNRTGYVLNYYTIRVTLQNYAYDKNVVVRYTVDNWATYKEAPLTYQSTDTYGYEIWETNLPIESSKLGSFEYCVCYEVNGQTYWANNFGENYNSSYVLHH